MTTQEIRINAHTTIRVAGYPSGPNPYGTRDKAIVSFEIGAGCGAWGAYGIHLTPEQAVEVANMLMNSVALARGEGEENFIPMREAA